MATTDRCCLVLWGAYCDEIAVTILVSRLRAAGCRVWLVGVSGGHMAGCSGLRIQPDLTPAEALSLVGLASCIVIPCDHSLLARFVNDPRVDELLTRAVQAQVHFVVSPTLAEHRLSGVTQYNLADAMSYGQGAALFDFATTLVAMLTAAPV